MPAWIPVPLRFLNKRLRHGAAASSNDLAAAFGDKARRCGFTLSESQRQAIACMSQQIEQHRMGQATGVYLYGPVGRGKSWLLDGFFQWVPSQSKLRWHFHDFFARLHQGVHRHQASGDAIGMTLDELIGHNDILCFDEFHVHDIGDAMLLTRLFEALFARGTLLVLTSNYAPEGLLPNPLYHQRFQPVIDLINHCMVIKAVGGDTDFRSLPVNRALQRFTQGRYVCAQRQSLHMPKGQGDTLMVNNRPLRMRGVAGDQIRFTFEDLCEQPTAVIDYLALARQYSHWIIEGLDDLGACSLAAQQRFVNVVDVLYDQDRQLTLIGSRPLAESLEGSLADLMRTRSRLGQLQQMGPAGAEGRAGPDLPP
ncbi:cell division protein ZapE [Pseudomonas sp. URMO17WK12:I11]|uniref:cell division protein ZapE n=1 Tax=Pseudomonas sp. URMO17WK12:I11 TaxID=1283291 RepID=UPI0011AAA286|nr:cell division protein ZapE [Pseudomonas sp. URMO17WK12:I11]